MPLVVLRMCILQDHIPPLCLHFFPVTLQDPVVLGSLKFTNCLGEVRKHMSSYVFIHEISKSADSFLVA